MKKITKSRKFQLIKDKELRNKFLADNIKVGLRYQLRSLRDSQNITQKELADLIKTKQSVISRLEKNPSRLSIPTLLDLAEAFDVGVVVRFESIDTVLDWYTNPSQKKMTPRKSEEVLKEMEKAEIKLQGAIENNTLLDEILNNNLDSHNTIPNFDELNIPSASEIVPPYNLLNISGEIRTLGEIG